jgi:YVTN family beta-propeller protein
MTHARTVLPLVTLVASLVPWSADAQATGFLYVTLEDSNAVAVVDTSSNTVVNTIQIVPANTTGTGTRPFAAAITPDARFAYVVNESCGLARPPSPNTPPSGGSIVQGTVTIIDISSPTNPNPAMATIIVGLCPRSVAITPDGMDAYVSNSQDGTVSVIDTQTHLVTNISLPTNGSGDGFPLGLAANPMGGYVYVAARSSTLDVISTATKSVVSVVPLVFGVPGSFGSQHSNCTPDRVAVTPDGSHVYVSSGSQGTVCGSILAIDTALALSAPASSIVASAPVNDFCVTGGLTIAPDGKRAYLVDWECQQLDVIDTTTSAYNMSISFIQFSTNPPTDVIITPDSQHAYLASSGGSQPSGLLAINTTTFSLPGTLTVPLSDFPAGMAFAPANTLMSNPAGAAVVVQPVDQTTGTTPVTLTFSDVTRTGMTTLVTSSTGPILPAGFQLGSVYYYLSTTAAFTGNITICIGSAAVTLGSQLGHNEGSAWAIVATTVNTTVVPPTICGTVSSLSPFAVLQPLPTANAGGPYSGNVGQTISFSGSGSTAPSGQTLTSYAWNFGDGTTGSGATPTHSYGSAASFTVSLTVTDTSGGTNTATTTATIITAVTPAIPTITWAPPAAIPYGTPLSVTELDATASVPGTFVYRPAIGALLAVGTQTLTATFTPSDTTDYTTASATVSLTVLDVPPTVVNVSVSTLEGVAVAIPVLANDSDPEGAVLSIASVTQPTHGAAAISGTMVLYTPAANFFGTDTFTYTAGDTYGGMSTATASVLVSRLGRFVALSQDFTWLRAGTIVTTGDVGAAVRRDLDHAYGQGFDDRDGDNVTVRVGVEATMQQAGSRVVGDTVALMPESSIENLVDNFLIDHGSTILGTTTSQMPVPFVTPPVFPAVTAGTQDVIVAQNKTLTLAAGSYGSVHVSRGATLILPGGLYQLRSLDVDQSATVLFHAAAEIRIKTELDTGATSKLVLDPSVTGLTASQIVIYVAGIDGVCHHDGIDAGDGDIGGPVAAHIGEGNVVQANIYAPNGTVWLKSNTQAAGGFIGFHVRIGIGVQLTLNSAFMQ